MSRFDSPLQHVRESFRFSAGLLPIGMLLMAVGVLLPANAFAQKPRMIKVFGDAKVDVMPDAVEFTATLRSNGKNSVAAFKKYREAQGAFNTAVNPMLFDGLTIKFADTKIGRQSAAQNAVAMAMGVEAEDEADADEPYSVQETALVGLTELEQLKEDEVRSKLAKLVDAIGEGGGVMNEAKPNPFGMSNSAESARYFISDPTSSIADCEKQAVEAARAKADRIAKLSGGKIGKVISIAEAVEPKGDEDQTSQLMELYGMGSETLETFSSSSYGPITVRVRLRIAFELLD